MRLDEERGRLSTGCAILLAVAALALALIWMRACSNAHIALHGWPGALLFPGFRPYLPLSLMGLIQAGLAVWVGLDARGRGLNGLLWGLLVFVTGIVGLLVYLIAGPAIQSGAAGATEAAAPSPSAICPDCSGAVEADFKACPRCGRSLRCTHCDRRIQSGWKVCPYCTAPLGGTA